MRRRLPALAVLFLVLALPSLAFATLIHNEDDQDHTVKLESGSGSISATIKANRAMVFRCDSYPCTVKFDGNSVTIRNMSDDVVIKDGQLTRKAKKKR